MKRHSCDVEIRKVKFKLSQHDIRDQAAVPEGTRWACRCGKAYVHVCDEAEGCKWIPA